MAKISVNDFSGGIQESYSPDDFSPRQSAVLKGIVPSNDRTFESQWAIQTIGSRTDFNAVFPLESQFGTYLVGITTAGAIYWCKAPLDADIYTAANSTSWTQITTAENKGYLAGATSTQPDISIESNPDYRFITGLPFEVYKYVKAVEQDQQTIGGSSVYVKDKFWYDNLEGTTTPTSIVSGVLIHCRRFYAGTTTKTLQFKPTLVDYNKQVAIVCYVDPLNTGGPVVKAATFPNIRRWPWYYTATTTNTAQANVSLIQPFVASAKHTTGTVPAGGFTSEYPHADFTGPDKWPKFYNFFHPYTYLDKDSALNPGYGFVPRANVGTMWGGLMILGDMEYMNEQLAIAKDDKTLKPVPSSALLGSSKTNAVLRDSITAPHRGSFYYSEGEMDVYDPRSVIRVSGTDTRIAGMHVIDNRLISITTSGSENDGVIVLSGNLSQIKSYETGTANPFAIRKQILKGNIGVADYTDTGNGHTTQTCLWADAGSVLFIDKLGGVFSTNGQTVNRIDTYGPKQPTSSSYLDHPAAVGRYAFIWRNKRLMLFTGLGVSDGQLSGCWTEISLPFTPSSESNIKSMIGSGNNLYLVINGKATRFALNGPVGERGRADNVKLDLTISTASIGIPEQFTKINWDKFGIGFHTTEGCDLKSITINAGPALQSGVPTHTPITSTRSFTSGYHSVVVPAGVGTRTIVSATYVFQGQVILEDYTFWYNGSTSNKEKTNA